MGDLHRLDLHRLVVDPAVQAERERDDQIAELFGDYIHALEHHCLPAVRALLTRADEIDDRAAADLLTAIAFYNALRKRHEPRP